MQPKDAQHVVLIHFPIALFNAGVAFDFLGNGEEACWPPQRIGVLGGDSSESEGRRQ